MISITSTTAPRHYQGYFVSQDNHYPLFSTPGFWFPARKMTEPKAGGSILAFVEQPKDRFALRVPAPFVFCKFVTRRQALSAGSFSPVSIFGCAGRLHFYDATSSSAGIFGMRHTDNDHDQCFSILDNILKITTPRRPPASGEHTISR